MKVTGSTIQQLDKGPDGRLPKSRCRDWRIWATTPEGRRSERFHGTYTRAQERQQAFISELEGQVPNAETFAAYAESWRLWREKSGELSPNGVAKDARNVRALCRTQLASRKMEDVTPEDCRNALMWLRENPAHGGGELSSTTIAAFHVALTSIFKQAVADGKMAANPMAAVKRPKERKPERTALSPEELALFLNRVDGLPLDGRAMALYLMACLGLRRGEALALMDADVADGLARVHLSVKEANGSVGEPKSPAGVRVLPMPGRLQAKVDEWRAERGRVGWQDAATLACDTRGGVLRPQNLYKWWMSVRDGLGCPGMVMHELRHSNLSMMARHMSAFDLQRYAGWSSIEPARVYIHDDLDATARAVSSAWNALEAESNAPKTHQNEIRSET